MQRLPGETDGLLATLMVHRKPTWQISAHLALACEKAVSRPAQATVTPFARLLGQDGGRSARPPMLLITAGESISLGAILGQ
jgi:hypothetical protein